MNYAIENITQNDWNSLAQIYKEGIDTGVATFQSEVPTWQEWDNNHISSCRFLAKSNDKVLGWVALSPTSSRCVYKGVAEVSIYIGSEFRGFGVGTDLLNMVIEESEKEGFWTLQSGIISKNKASLCLHKNCGFREIGIREKVAKMNNSDWLDVTLMERRSSTTGLN